MAILLLAAAITTLVGTGAPAFSDTQVNNPYGMAMGPDGALYFWTSTTSAFGASI